jgi:hypothetical protein
MNHLAIAGTGLGTNVAVPLQDQHFFAGTCECAGAGKPNHTGADHDRFNPLNQNLSAMCDST